MGLRCVEEEDPHRGGRLQIKRRRGGAHLDQQAVCEHERTDENVPSALGNAALLPRPSFTAFALLAFASSPVLVYPSVLKR
jgi:hypothetical protein